MTPRASPILPRRYLSIWLPHLAADCWRASARQPAIAAADPPLVFTERHANAVRLSALSVAAEALGLQPGLTLADARARVPELVAIERDHAAEARMLARLVAGARRYSPAVAPEPPDGLVLDIAGCTHAFGGEAGLVRDLACRLAEGGIEARIAGGDTPESARARARFARTPGCDLHHLPVAALEAAPEVTVALRRAGLKTIGDLARRPSALLSARFGDLALRLHRLLGEEDRRISPARPPAPVFALRRFAEPIARTDDALACLDELMREAGTTLLERHEGGRRFEARLFRSDGKVAQVAVETGAPTRDAGVLIRLLRERIDALADPIDPGFGFDLIRLDVVRTEPLAPTQAALDAGAEAGEPLAALIDRLAARLGAQRIVRAQPLDSHLPECASMATTPAQEPCWPAPLPGEPPLRPIQLLDPPQRVADVTYGLPEGPPRRFTWAGRPHEIARWEGPERIAPEWWRRPGIPRAPDPETPHGPLTRDYYRVEDAAGHRFWLFRHGLQGRERTTPDWYLHGLFA